MGEFFLFAVVLGTVLTIAWIILPFALIGTKPLLRELIAETKRTNKLLEYVAEKQPSATTKRTVNND
jgi:hypothetical protein